MSEAAVDELGFASGPWLEAGLDDALARLDQLLLGARGGAVSFDVGGPAPERELLAALAAFDRRSVSFTTEHDEHGPADERQVAGWLDRLLELASGAARVETRVKGRLVASTRVGLGGDVVSAIGPSASRSEIALHSTTLDRSLRTRRARMRLVLSIVQAATKIAFAIGSANPLAALPAAWRFIRSVIAEWEPRQ